MSEVRTNSITDAAGTGAPDFPNGLTTGVASFPDGSAAAPSITNTDDTNTGIFFPAADTIAFAEGGVESMRIDSSGNLMVGTTAASGYRMNITGGRSGLTTSAGDSYVLYMRNPSFTNGCHIGNPGENMFAVSTASGAERLVIGASGQIGINGVNYGASGQVLTSGGSGAAPSWASVGTATAGLAYGDVGSYGWLATRTTASVVAGSTYAGSGLVPAGVYSNINVADNSAGPANGSAIGVGSGALSGTWRAMGSFTFGSGNTYVRGTTFLRIS